MTWHTRQSSVIGLCLFKTCQEKHRSSTLYESCPAHKSQLSYGHLGQARKAKGADCSLLFFRRQFTCFPKHEECCRELRPRNRSLGSIHLSGKQGVMGKVLHGNFPVRKKDGGNGQPFPKRVITNNNQTDSYWLQHTSTLFCMFK